MHFYLCSCCRGGDKCAMCARNCYIVFNCRGVVFVSLVGLRNECWAAASPLFQMSNLLRDVASFFLESRRLLWGFLTLKASRRWSLFCLANWDMVQEWKCRFLCSVALSTSFVPFSGLFSDLAKCSEMAFFITIPSKQRSYYTAYWFFLMVSWKT